MKDILEQISNSDLMAFGGGIHALKARLAAADKLGAVIANSRVPSAPVDARGYH